MADCKVNEIFRGEVSSVQNYGAFIKIPGCFQQGLVHKTQVSSSYVDDVADILQKGDKIWCKIISINDDGKIALSMKYVNQGNGRDLDPNGVQLDLDNQKRKSMGNRDEKKAIVLEAVYKTTCAKCKTPGHLARDCFSTPDGKKYELIPEDDEKPSLSPAPPQQSKVEDESESKPKEKEKKHKSKKSKKRKKNKSSHKDSSDDEESGSSDEKKKKKKKKSKESRHKKKKRHHSSSDSDSSDSDSSLDRKHSKKCKRSKEKHGD